MSWHRQFTHVSRRLHPKTGVTPVTAVTDTLKPSNGTHLTSIEPVTNRLKAVGNMGNTGSELQFVTFVTPFGNKTGNSTNTVTARVRGQCYPCYPCYLDPLPKSACNPRKSARRFTHDT